MSVILNGVVAKIKSLLPSISFGGARTMSDVVADLTSEASDIASEQQAISDAAQVVVNESKDIMFVAKVERNKANEFLAVFGIEPILD